jgi:hypothetical protein
MERDEEFFIEVKAIKFVCEFVREKYPEHSYLLWVKYSCDVLKECNKNASN